MAVLPLGRAPHPQGALSCRCGQQTGQPQVWMGPQGRGASASWCSRCWASPWTRCSSFPTGTGGRCARGSWSTQVGAPRIPAPHPRLSPRWRLRLTLPVPAADAYCLLEVYWALCREPARFHLSGDLARSLRLGRGERAGPGELPPLQKASTSPQQVGEARQDSFITIPAGRSLSLELGPYRVGDRCGCGVSGRAVQRACVPHAGPSAGKEGEQSRGLAS